MHSLSIPAHTYEEVYNACIFKLRETVKNKFGQALLKLMPVMDLYDQHMMGKTGHQLNICGDDDFHPLGKDELKWLYDSRLMPGNGPGRNYYDKFLVRSKKRSCCFCSYDDPIELDHFLPKSKFAHFAINPNNLVPVCHRCNKLKHTYYPKTALENLIHPFFENYDEQVWLHARLIYSDNTPVAFFYIECDDLDYDIIHRLDNHFTKIELYERYASQASREISGAEGKFRKAFNERGYDGLRGDLLDEAESRARFHKNSWQCALYKGLANDSRFLSMDWSL